MISLCVCSSSLWHLAPPCTSYAAHGRTCSLSSKICEEKGSNVCVLTLYLGVCSLSQYSPNRLLSDSLRFIIVHSHRLKSRYFFFSLRLGELFKARGWITSMRIGGSCMWQVVGAYVGCPFRICDQFCTPEPCSQPARTSPYMFPTFINSKVDLRIFWSKVKLKRNWKCLRIPNE